MWGQETQPVSHRDLGGNTVSDTCGLLQGQLVGLPYWHTYSQTRTHAWIKSIIPAAPEIDRSSQLFLSGPFTFDFWIPIFILFLSVVSLALFLLHLSLSTALPPLINWRWRQLFYDGVPQLYAGGESVKNIEFARDDLWATKKFAFDNFKPLTIGHSIMMSRP